MNLYEIVTGPYDPVMATRLEEFVKENLPEFMTVYEEHPIETPRKEYLSNGECFWLYFLTKALEPKVIVESGTMHGWSVYFLQRAAPEAEIHTFDPYAMPVWHGDNIEYHTCGWGWVPWLRPDLVFFDDHVGQCGRLREAMWRKVRHMVFHDNYPTRSERSHVPLRFCGLPEPVRQCFIFESHLGLYK